MKRFIKYLNISFYSLVILYCVVWLISWHFTSPIVYIHEINILILWILGFETSKKIGLKYIIKKAVKFPIKQINYILLGLLTHIFIHPFFMGMTGKSAALYEFKWRHIIFGPYLAKNINILFQIISIGVITLLVFSLYHSYLKNGKKAIKKVFKYTGVAILVIGSLFTSYNYFTDDIYLNFDKEPKSIKEFMVHQELKGKYLYVDFWHSGCAPCIKDLKKYEQFLTKLPKSVRDNIEFVFIGVDRSTPGELTKQKYYIKKLNIEAKHYFISKPTLYQWWDELNKNEKSTPQFSHYYLINPKGKVELKNGPKIGDELESFLIKKTALNLQ